MQQDATLKGKNVDDDLMTVTEWLVLQLTFGNRICIAAHRNHLSLKNLILMKKVFICWI
jgi:hypothetical protein